MASYFWREIFYVPFPGTPGKIPGNSGSTELRKEFGTTPTPLSEKSWKYPNLYAKFWKIFKKKTGEKLRNID